MERHYTIDTVNKTVRFSFEHDNDSIKKDIKYSSYDAHWNNSLKRWIVPVSSYSVQKIKEIIKKYGFIEKVEEKEKEEKYDYSLTKERKNELEKLCKEKDFSYIPRDYQIEALAYSIDKGNVLNGEDVGCIEGDADIQMIRCHKSQHITLRELYNKFNGINGRWNRKFDTYIKSFDEKRQIFVHQKVEQVLSKGVKEVVEVVLKSGNRLKLTPDHEVYSKKYGWKPIGDMKVGESIFSNGKLVCKRCGSTENVAYRKDSKYQGYCRKCITRYLRKNTVKTGKWINPDGYVMVSGVYDNPRSSKKNTSVEEHILVMEKHIGRFLLKTEVVHHIDRNKQNNDISNLQLLTQSEHSKIHAKENYANFNNGKLVLIQIEDEIVSINDAGKTDVYDVVMQSPNHSFVANKILVHNCGKTFEAILYAEITDSFPCLVVTPSSVKYNWKEKWEEITKNKRDVSTIDSSDKVKNWDSDVVVVNYDILGKKQGKGATVKYKELKSDKWKMIIFDEAHFLKNKQSQRSIASKMIIKKAKEAKIQLLSGTITMSKPSELWNLLVLSNNDKLIASSWMEYVTTYCGGYRGKFGWVTDGATNTIKLNKLLRDSCYIRREKSDVLKDLPKAIKTVLHVPITNKKTIDRALENFIQYVRETKGEDDAERAMEAEHLVAISEMRKLAIQGKMKAIESYLKDWAASGRKLVVFGIHKEALDKLSTKFKCQKIVGGVSSSKKQSIVNDWQNNDDIFLFINIESGGTGVDGLQKVCSDMLIIELPWRPSDLEQTIGRLDRSGQKVSPNVIFALSNDTIDKHMWEMLSEKEKVTEAVNKGIDVEKNKSGIKSVINKILRQK